MRMEIEAGGINESRDERYRDGYGGRNELSCM